MSVIGVAVLVALAVLVHPATGRRSTAGRLRALASPRPETHREAMRPPPVRSTPADRGVVRRVAAVLGGLSGAAALTDTTGIAGAVIAGLVVAGGLDRALTRLRPEARRRHARLEGDVPAGADLLAACLVTGCPLPDAVEAVADALGGPIAEELRTATSRIRLGGEPDAVFGALCRHPALAPLGRTLARATDSGSPLAQTLTRMADEQRGRRRRAASAAAQRVAVWSAAPLGLCFLPAFVLLAVVPLIAGIFPQRIGGF